MFFAAVSPRFFFVKCDGAKQEGENARFRLTISDGVLDFSGAGELLLLKYFRPESIILKKELMLCSRWAL
jgi:hypothetical protein